MTPLTLRRIDPARNPRRFSRRDVQSGMFGLWCLVREWGRIGSPGRMMMQPFPTSAEAEAAAARLVRAEAPPRLL